MCNNIYMYIHAYVNIYTDIYITYTYTYIHYKNDVHEFLKEESSVKEGEEFIYVKEIFKDVIIKYSDICFTL